MFVVVRSCDKVALQHMNRSVWLRIWRCCIRVLGSVTVLRKGSFLQIKTEAQIEAFVLYKSEEKNIVTKDKHLLCALPLHQPYKSLIKRACFTL